MGSVLYTNDLLIKIFSCLQINEIIKLCRFVSPYWNKMTRSVTFQKIFNITENCVLMLDHNPKLSLRAKYKLAYHLPIQCLQSFQPYLKYIDISIVFPDITLLDMLYQLHSSIEAIVITFGALNMSPDSAYKTLLQNIEKRYILEFRNKVIKCPIHCYPETDLRLVSQVFPRLQNIKIDNWHSYAVSSVDDLHYCTHLHTLELCGLYMLIDTSFYDILLKTKTTLTSLCIRRCSSLTSLSIEYFNLFSNITNLSIELNLIKSNTQDNVKNLIHIRKLYLLVDTSDNYIGLDLSYLENMRILYLCDLHAQNNNGDAIHNYITWKYPIFLKRLFIYNIYSFAIAELVPFSKQIKKDLKHLIHLYIQTKNSIDESINKIYIDSYNN